MRQGLFGFRKPHTPAAAAATPAAAAAAAPSSSTPAAAAAVSIAAASPATANEAAAAESPAVPSSDPLAITHKVELNITQGGQLVGKVVLGLFGNTAPKTVQNVSQGIWFEPGVDRHAMGIYS
jgi:hypothetical protein